MNKLGKCFNSGDNLLSFTEWDDLKGTDEKEAAEMLMCDEGTPFGTSPCDPVIFLQFPDHPHEKIVKAQCGVREHILNSLLKTPRVYNWRYQGMVRLLFPFYKFPLLQIHIDEHALNTLKNPNYWAFFIVRRGDEKLTTARQIVISSLHGDYVPTYTLLPLTESEIIAFLREDNGFKYKELKGMLARVKEAIKMSKNTVANIVEQVDYVNKVRMEDFKEMGSDMPGFQLSLFSEKKAKVLQMIYKTIRSFDIQVLTVMIYKIENDAITDGFIHLPRYNMSNTDIYIYIVANDIIDRTFYGLTFSSSYFNNKSVCRYPNGSFMRRFFDKFIIKEQLSNVSNSRKHLNNFQTFLENLHDNYIRVKTRDGYVFTIRKVRPGLSIINNSLKLTNSSLMRLMKDRLGSISYIHLYSDDNLAEYINIK